jgi:NADPH2:quinone reductase
MKAWTINNFSGIEQARLVDVPDPRPAAIEVLLRVKFAALNPADAYLAKGEYPGKPPLPHILGRDGVGEIVAVGNAVRDLSTGIKRAILRSDVGVNRWGTFAELVAVPVESLVEIPAGWSDEQASAATLVYLTAYQALTQWDVVKPSAAILISGASGGVGVACTQLGVAMGHTVIGLSRDAEKREKLKGIGMALALDPSNPNWKTELSSFLKGGKVDLVIDNIGGTLFNDLLATLGYRGRVSVVGRLAGPVPEFNTASLFFRRLRIGGVAVGSYTNSESRMAWQQVLELLAKTGAKPLVDQVFPFEKLPQAFGRLARGPMGKVVVAVNSS